MTSEIFKIMLAVADKIGGAIDTLHVYHDGYIEVNIIKDGIKHRLTYTTEAQEGEDV